MQTRTLTKAAGLALLLLFTPAVPADQRAEPAVTGEDPVGEAAPGTPGTAEDAEETAEPDGAAGTEDTGEAEAPDEGVPEDVPEDLPDVLIVRPPSAPDEPEGNETDETALEAAERRIEDLEARVTALEAEIDTLHERQETLEDALARLDALEDAFVEREAQREEAAAARAARSVSLDALATELEGIFATLTRGFDNVDRPLADAAARITAFAGEAARFGQAREADRLQAASRALETARAALRRRDLYETRLYVGLATGHVQSARDMARAELTPPR